MYMPVNNDCAVPQRMVSAALAPIVTMSGTDVYPGMTNHLAAAGSLTTTASLNGRKVGIARWTEPQLLLPAATSSLAATPPNWIIFTRKGPQGFSAGTTPQSAGLTSSGLSNMNEAVGRYAYIVYDTSGLIDVNVAGYPAASGSAAAAKGILSCADLTQLSSGTATITTTDVRTWSSGETRPARANPTPI